MTGPVLPGRGRRRPGSRLAEEASEPLGLSLGTATALAAWLLAVPAGAAVVIGLATWGIRTAAAVLGRQGDLTGGLPPRIPVAGMPVVVAWRSALDRCLSAVRAAGGQVWGWGERMVDRPVALVTPGRHHSSRARLRARTAAEDSSPPPGIVDEVLDPLTLGLGLAASGAALLAGLPGAAAACVGAATVLLRAAVGALGRAGPPGQRPALAPASPIDPGSIEAQWLERARWAAAAFSDAALSMTSEPFAGQAAAMRLAMRLQITETLGVLEGLAVRSSAARRALDRTDVQALGAEAERLQAERAWASGTVAQLLGHSLAAVEARMDLQGQLQSVRAGILARLEMSTVHLEHLAGRMAKLALSSAVGPALAPGEVDELFDRLAAVRSGVLAPTDDGWRAWEPGATAAAG